MSMRRSILVFRLGMRSLSTHVRNYGDVFRQAAGARHLTAMLARYVTVFPNSCTKLGGVISFWLLDGSFILVTSVVNQALSMDKFQDSATLFYFRSAVRH